MPETALDYVQLKQQIAAEILGDLPDGIRNFLDAEIPAPPAASLPTDEESAIIVNGKAAWYILELFRPLAGMTWVQIPMYLSQFNSVQHGMLLASLEVASPVDPAVNPDFDIVEPKADTIYYPGEMRITVKDKNADIERVTALITVSGARSLGKELDLKYVDGVWRQYVNLMENGTYDLFVSAYLPDDETPLVETLTFQIGDDVEDAEVAEGADKDALDKAVAKVEEAMRALADQPVSSLDDVKSYAGKWLGAIKAYYGTIGSIGKKVVTGDAAGALDQFITEGSGLVNFALEKLSTIDEELTDGDFTAWDVASFLSPDIRKFALRFSMLKNLVGDSIDNLRE